MQEIHRVRARVRPLFFDFCDDGTNASARIGAALRRNGVRCPAVAAQENIRPPMPVPKQLTCEIGAVVAAARQAVQTGKRDVDAGGGGGLVGRGE